MGSVDVELAVWDPDRARLEFTGPLGIRLGLLQINPEWVHLYLIRENTVFRIPTSELGTDSPRLKAFQQLAPVPLLGEALFYTLLGRVDAKELKFKPTGQDQCFYDKATGHYVVKQDAAIAREIWINRNAYYPHKMMFYIDKTVPGPWIELRFSGERGEGPATLLAKSEIWLDGQKKLSFEWDHAEVWDAPDPKVFEWAPKASMVIKDY
jgi:hypothetical protein